MSCSWLPDAMGLYFFSVGMLFFRLLWLFGVCAAVIASFALVLWVYRHAFDSSPWCLVLTWLGFTSLRFAMLRGLD